MNKFFFKFPGLFGFAILLGCSFFTQSARAETGLVLETMKKCDIQYAGDSCVAEFKLTNNTGYVLDGTAFLHIDYQGLCSNNELRNFDGEGIKAQFSNGDNWLNFSDSWEDGTTTVPGLEIAKGEAQPKFRIETVSNLCPGNYTFTLVLKGATEKKEYITPPVVIGGGGGGGYSASPAIPVSETSEVTAISGEGGIVALTNLDGSGIKLTVPPGAVSEDTTFTIKRVDISSVNQPGPTSGLFLIAGSVYKIKAERDGNLITTFNKPLTLTFIYTNEQVKGLDESSLKIYWWNSEKWVALENSKVDIGNNRVVASINHFTIFALIGLKTVSPREGIGGEISKETGTFRAVKGISKTIARGIKKITKETAPSASEEVGLPKEATSSKSGAPQKGLASVLAAAIGVTWGGISKPIFLTVIVILCLVGLVFISIKKRRLFRKKRKK